MPSWISFGKESVSPVLQELRQRADLTVPVGPKGDQGDPGAEGPAGPAGPQGLQGDPGAADAWTYVKLASDFSTGLTVNTAVTGFLFTPAASKTYIVEGGLLVSSVAKTTGARPGVSWPTGCVGGVMLDAPNSNTARAMRNGNAGVTANAASTGLPLVNTAYLASLYATFNTNGFPVGNFQVTLASEIVASNVTMLAGSWFRYREI